MAIYNIAILIIIKEKYLAALQSKQLQQLLDPPLPFSQLCLNLFVSIWLIIAYILEVWLTATYLTAMEDVMPAERQLAPLPLRVCGLHSSTFARANIVSNHYFVELKAIEKIVIFSVRFTPMIAADNSKLRNQLLSQAMLSIRSNISNPVISGMNIYSLQETHVKQQQYQCSGYCLKTKQVKVYSLKQNPKLLLAFLNNGLRNVMRRLNYVQIGKSGKYFNSHDHQQIDNLIMYNGFKSNFTLLQKGFYLRVDAAKKIVRNETVLNCIDNLIKIHREKDKQERRNQIRAELIGKVVMANYGKTCYYTIQDILFDDLEKIVLDGTSMTLKTYYEEKYKIQIKNPRQPLLVAENRKKDDKVQKTLLVPELMLMTGIPEDFDEMRRKKISESTIKQPGDKMREIAGLMNRLKDSQQLQALRGLGIAVNRDMEKLEAKVMPAPFMQLGKKNSVQKGKEAFFNLFNKPIFASKHDVACALIYFKGTDVNGLVDTFNKTSGNLGVTLKIREYAINGRPSIPLIESQMNSAVEQGNNICCVVLPGNMKSQYKQLKVAAIRNIEIVSQVVTDITLRKKNLQSIATKVLLQLIAKRGNTLWVPRPSFEISKTMLAGFEQAKMGNGYLLSVCATINSTFSSVYSSTTSFDSNQQKYSKMSDLLLLAINSYVVRNDKPPAEIIVFMNSCAGDQVSLYQQFFMEPFNSKATELYRDCIAVSVVMVNTKTSERFFVNDRDQVRNVQAGTLISEHLVSPNYDFYIISQQSNRGTSVPNHYRVIYSSSKLEEGKLQELIFSQCFNYVNWTGSIKVPAVLQYAKKCVKFGAEVLQRNEVPQSLTTKLYFV